ncbi:1-(5-phosphoribosyl)-5-[(5-phosphoribosylamino)methylideneamino]imidazole-4-carboxamide isomerase [Campylobacter sp. MIT 12-5580]|nr:1-(5-phosphoribosyl)-5-[(5-phosphoribosylamino)methylideneamino]imidazole-4-carboxamide isomerase [Campylobacter sp. MIT 12-5580]
MITQLIPALDLLDGKVVRLFKGDYAQQKSYHFEPLEKFRQYEEAGAKWLHLVDLQGAKNPQNRQIKLLEKLSNEVVVNLQVGGGVRNEADIKALLEAGAKRVVIGSLAVKDPEFTSKMLKEFGAEQITLALDALPNADGSDYLIAINAWQEQSGKRLLEVLDFYAELGLKHLLCTDISRDGTMSGANIELYTLIHRIFPQIEIQASGGVSSLEDLRLLKGVCSGVIVGKALLDNKFSVKEALACLQNA